MLLILFLCTFIEAILIGNVPYKSIPSVPKPPQAPYASNTLDQFQPVYNVHAEDKETYLCAPFAAVGKAGGLSMGTDHFSRACMYNAGKSQVYARAGTVQDGDSTIHGFMYTWFHPWAHGDEGNTGPRHEWFVVIVWANENDLGNGESSFTPFALSWQEEDTFSESEWTYDAHWPWVRFDVAAYLPRSSHSMITRWHDEIRLGRKSTANFRRDRQPLLTWDDLTDGQRGYLGQYDFSFEARQQCPITEYHFQVNLQNSYNQHKSQNPY